MTHKTPSTRVGIIGGSGLGEALLEGIAPEDVQTVKVQTPFGMPSSPITLGTFAGTPIAMLQRHGPGHVLNPSQVPYRANVFALKSVGCTHVVASGATGSLQEDIAPGDLVVCDQLIDKTEGRPRTFFEKAAVHVEFADPFCPVMRDWLQSAALAVSTGWAVHSGGTYLCMEGPSFSTRAESHMHRKWGADLVGMTACPEARLAREAEMAYALIALPTDYDCWRRAEPDPYGLFEEDEDQQSLLEEIIGNLRRATEASIAVIAVALSNVGPLETTPSPAHNALALAIWSDKSQIDPAEIERLDTLWGRYFQRANAVD